MSKDDFIRLEGVGKIYPAAAGSPPALARVDLRVAEGEFVALMGPSGSGKSTLLAILGAMNEPTTGRVLVDGIDVYGLADEKRADFRHEYLGFVFQQQHLLPYLTAVENVELPLAVAPVPSREKRGRALAALGRVGLEGKEHRLPSELSGGEQARVAIARAVANEPPLVLADEPTGNLDSVTGHAVMDMLAELNGSGQTVVVVTHDEAIAARAGRIVRLLDGHVVEDTLSSVERNARPFAAEPVEAGER
jgi:putative ABC transport system ATP-binding protein